MWILRSKKTELSKHRVHKLLSQLNTLTEKKLKKMADWDVKKDLNQSIENLISNVSSDSDEIQKNYEKQKIILDELEEIYLQYSKSLTEELISILKFNKEDEMRKNAAFILGYLKIEESIKPLIGSLSGDPEVDVREKAAYALGEIKITNFEPLIHSLEYDKSYWVRAEAACSLGKIRMDSALGSLGKSLENDPESWVRISAAAALGRFDSEKAIDFLEKANSEDKDPMVKKQAEKSIIEILRRKKEKIANN